MEKIKSKYREKDHYPTASTRPFLCEKENFKELIIKNLRAKCNASGLMALSYTLGKTIDQVCSLEINKDLIYRSQYYLRVNINLGDSQWQPEKEHENIFHDSQDFLELPLPHILSEWLETVAPKNTTIQLKDLIGDAEEHEKPIKKYIDNLRVSGSPSMDKQKIEYALSNEIFSNFDNPVYDYLLRNLTNLEPPHSRYYYVPSISELENAWNTTQSLLWQTKPCIHNLTTTDDIYNGYVVRKEVLQNFIKRASNIPKLKPKITISNIVEIHNKFTLYVVSLMVWNLGHRSSIDPFCDMAKWSKPLEIFLISDKSRHGGNNTRVIPIPSSINKQLNNYKSHLKNISDIASTFDSLKDLALYTHRLFKDKVNDNYRYFFLLNNDGTQNAPITPSLIIDFMEEHGLHVRENFGRHHIATRLSNFENYSFRDVQLFLGHSLGNKTKKTSEVNLSIWLEKTRNHLEDIIIEDEWSIINGCPKRKLAHSIELKKKLSSNFLHNEELGHINRSLRNKARSKAISDTSKEIKKYITDYLINHVRNIKLENKLLRQLDGLDFPHHKNWAPLLNQFKNENLEYSPIASILKKFRFELKNSSINPLLAEQAEDINSAKSAFLEWINNKKITGWSHWVKTNSGDYDQDKLYSTLALSSSLFGNLTRVETLNSLIDTKNFRTQLYKTQDVVYLEVLKKPEKTQRSDPKPSELWIDRWHPDAFSLAIITQLQSHTSNNPVKIKEHLQYSFKLLNISFNSRSNPISTLSRFVRPILKLQTPFYLNALETGYILRRPLAHPAFVRLLTNKRYKEETTEEKEKYRPTPKVEFSEFLKMLRKDFQASVASIPIQNHSQKDRNQIVSNNLKLLGKSSDGLSHIQEMFSSWAAYLCEVGSKGDGIVKKVRHLSHDTLIGYIATLGNQLKLHLQDTDDLSKLDPDELTEFHESLVQNNKAESNSKVLVRMIVHFHNFAMERYKFGACDWGSLSTYINHYSPPRSGNIVTPHEYQQLINILFKQVNKNNQLETLQCLFISIVMYRFGLRIKECLKLKPHDLVFEDNELKMIYVRYNALGKPKSKSGNRKIPSIYKLEPFEKWILSYFSQRGLFYSRLSPYFAILSKEPNDVPVKYSNILSGRIMGVLKFVSGDKSINTYSLRHSYATNTVANIINPTRDHKTFLFEEADITPFTNNNTFDKPIAAFSVVMGHKTPSVTLGRYTHCHSLFSLIDHDSVNKISDDCISPLLNKTTKTYKRSRQRLDEYKNEHDVAYKYTEKLINNDDKSDFRSSKELPFPKVNDFKSTNISFMETIELLICTKLGIDINSSNFLCNEDTVVKSQEHIFEFNQKGFTFGMKEFFDSLTNPDINRFLNWAINNQELIHAISRHKQKRSLMLAHLDQALQMSDSEDNDFIALEGKQTRMLEVLLKNLNIQQVEISKQTTRSKIKSKPKNITLNNHAANSKHNHTTYKEKGFELQLQLPPEIVNNRTLKAILFSVLCFLTLANSQ